MRLKIIAMFIAVVFLAGCGRKKVEINLVPESYRDWESTVEGPLTYQIPGHAMLKRITFINEIGQRVSAVEQSGRMTYDYPKGTIIVKEMYPTADSTEPDHLTVMIKDTEDAQSMVGWIWLIKDLKTGKERVFGIEDFCVACHRNANDRHPYGDRNVDSEYRDYVYYPWRSP